MLINLRNALMAGKRLPYDAEVEYLESTGTQRIEIGMTFDARCVLDATFQFTRFVNAATCHGQTSATAIQARFAFGKGAASWNDWYCGIGNKNYRTGKALDLAVHRFVVDAPGDKFVIDDTTYNVGWTSFDLPSNPNSATLYNRARVDSSVLDESGVYGKLHCCQIHQDGVLVRDFVPVRVDTVGYLYDRVSGNLFGNAGTGDFILGPDVVPVEYIESHGTEWIDTGVKGKPGYDFESAITFTQLSDSIASAIGGVYGDTVACYVGVVRTNKRFAYIFDGAPIVEFSSATPNTPYIVKSHQFSGSQYLEINGVRSTEGVKSATFESAGNIYLMSLNNLSGTQVFSHMKMSHCRIYFNSAPVRFFRPVRVGTDATSWEGAMMDTLTRRIYRNAGTGAFTYGNDLKYGALNPNGGILNA